MSGQQTADSQQPTGRMHGSVPAAKKLLAFMRRNGGSATTRQIREDLDSCAPHSDVAALRDYARDELGVQTDKPITKEYLGRSERKKRVYRYTLCRELMDDVATAGNHRDPSTSSGQAPDTENPRIRRGDACAARSVQAVLFEMRRPIDEG